MAKVILPSNPTIQVEYPDVEGAVVDIEINNGSIAAMAHSETEKMAEITSKIEKIRDKHSKLKKTTKDENGKDVLLTGLDALDENHADTKELLMLLAQQSPYILASRIEDWSLYDTEDKKVDITPERIGKLDGTFVSSVLIAINKYDNDKKK